LKKSNGNTPLDDLSKSANKWSMRLGGHTGNEDFWVTPHGCHIGRMTELKECTIRNNRAAWQRGCLQMTHPDTKPHYFGDVMLTRKLLSPNVYFQIEMEN
jgi:hypothetical protein